MSAWFHGGIPGLAPGDRILPPDVTGTDHTLSHVAAALGMPHGTRTDIVYATRIEQYARVYAALYPDGALYRVEPEGPVEPDPDASEAAIMAPSARITAVVRPVVVYAHRRPESWLRILTRQETR